MKVLFRTVLPKWIYSGKNMKSRLNQLRRLVNIVAISSLGAFGRPSQASQDPQSSTDGSPSSSAREMSPAELAAMVSPQVVQIETDSGLGSGFFVTNDLVVTSLHVVQGTAKIRLKSSTWNGTVTNVVAWDANADIAIVRVQPKAPVGGLTVSKGPYSIGTRILVVSSPLGLQSTVSDGLLSAIREKPNLRLQFTAPISPGSSGAPIVDAHGNVLGVVSGTVTSLAAGRTYGQNLNFAIPSTAIHSLMSHPKNTDVNAFAIQTASEEEKRWKTIESSLPTVGDALKAELGPTVGPVLAIAIRKAVDARDSDGLVGLLNRRDTLKESRSRLFEVAVTLANTGHEGELLGVELIKSWDESTIHPSAESENKFVASMKKARSLLERYSSASSLPFPEQFAGFPFMERAAAVFSYCYPGYTIEEVPGFATLECPRVPVLPPFATGKASLEFLNGALVDVELTVKSYSEAVKTVTVKYGSPEFSVLTQGHWTNSSKKPSFGPNTSYNWQLKGGRIRIGRTVGAPFIVFVHSGRDLAMSNSY
jgi:hypothetical protein